MTFSEIVVLYVMSVAGVAHPVERHLAKVEVASSSLVTRSIKDQSFDWSFSFVRGIIPMPENGENSKFFILGLYK